MTSNNIIGRVREKKLLADMCAEREARLIAVYGRRRVGKTYLIKNYFNDEFDFAFTGSFETPTALQLSLFNTELNRYSKQRFARPADWFEAFSQLRQHLERLDKKQMIVFLDELPWMDNPKSNFLKALSYFWNTWASGREGLKIIVCGSATSWMLDKVIGDKGGLYGRSSRSIYISPFNLGEVEEFLRARKNITWSRYQILELYMILGGIPYYLDMLERDLPFATNIDNLFFAPGAPLRAEYQFLFRSLFKSDGTYRQVVEALAKRGKGLTLSEIKASIKGSDGGGLSKVLANLCSCDFIRKYTSYGKRRKNVIYQLTDLFCFFHLKFVETGTAQDEHFWSNLKESRRAAWTGYAFEQVCLHHVRQLRHKLGIEGVLTNVCSWSSPRHVDTDGTEWPGMQLDLLLCRDDNVTDVCEMKYCRGDFVITKDYERQLRERTDAFARLTRTRDALHNVLVTTYGLKQNLYSGIIHNVVTMDDLFVK